MRCAAAACSDPGPRGGRALHLLFVAFIGCERGRQAALQRRARLRQMVHAPTLLRVALRRKGMNVPAPAPLLRPGQDADVTVHKLRCALLDVGVKGVAVGAPRTVVLPE